MCSCLYVRRRYVCECEDVGTSAGVFACVYVCARTADVFTTEQSIFPTAENHLTY